jgi:hypothetical protein
MLHDYVRRMYFAGVEPIATAAPKRPAASAKR